MEEEKKNWPADGLENVPRCPVCGCRDRDLSHSGLRDNVFFCAPGEWMLYRCHGCGSGYLDPRPTAETIGLAYTRYFTHKAAERPDVASLKWAHRTRRALANGYRNRRFGTQDSPAFRFGDIVAFLLPAQRAILDAKGRHLPRPHAGGWLLDVGCGNGAFMEFARSAGWQIEGLDLDASAVAAARGQGLKVHLGGIEVLEANTNRYDGITLSHIIEHVHEPLSLLRTCYSLLKAGGWIWIDTPNFEAQGYRRYGQNWRALEPPRHLALFTRRALLQALELVGFMDVEDQSARPLCRNIYAASEAIVAGRDPYCGNDQTTYLSAGGKRAAAIAERKARRNADIREFVTVKAWKK